VLACRLDFFSLKPTHENLLTITAVSKPSTHRMTGGHRFNFCHDGVRSDDFEHFFKCRNPNSLSTEWERLSSVHGKLIPGVESLELVKCSLLNRASPIGGSGQRRIMDYDEMSIHTAVEVKLNTMSPHINCVLKRGKCVLGREGSGSPVANNTDF
jgi:hypothetical protein